MQVVISTDDKGVERQFRKFAKNADNMSMAFEKVAVSIAEGNKRNWARGVTLADTTIEKKAAAGHPEPLVWSGRLKGSLTEIEHEDAIREVRPYEMQFGTKVFYGRFQQSGTKTMPKHKVLKFTVKTKRMVVGILQGHLHQ